VSKFPRKGLTLAAVLLMAGVAPVRGDDIVAWWNNFAANTKTVTLPDGKKLALYCEGEGAPVVMMDAGMGPGGISSWRKVQPAVARVTKVCTYDRAGIGNSAPTDAPRDAGAEADDLAALLKAAKLPTPYVIVAHSYGGYVARLYAGRHTGDVAGLLLVDPATAHQDRYYGEAVPAVHKGIEDFAALLKECSAEPRPATLEKKCVRPPPSDMPPGMMDAYRRSQAPATAGAIARELAAMPALSSDLLVREKKSLGAVPFVVLRRDPTKPDPEYSAQDSAAIERVGLKMHLEIMDISSDSQLLIVPGAGHNIQSEKPGAVIAAITDMVWKIRRNSR
jgi:pimeloyl-ACP methyl ester carboxylesterase